MFHSNNGQIDIFDAEYFESKLPKSKKDSSPLWTKQAIKGEWCYLIRFGFKNAWILVRSSIDTQTNMSRETGQDSIRCYVVDKDNYPLLGKNKRWTTRVAGWESRLWNDLTALRKQFVKYHKMGIVCPKCGKPLKIQTNQKKQNFVKCWECEPGNSGWETYRKIDLTIDK